MSTPLSSARIRALALEAGFSLCGFARAEPLPPTTLTTWLESGFAADMDWMAERMADRLDVQRLLPEAQTVVALACGYRTAEETDSLIARYARGRDYHYTLQDRLRALRRLLKQAFPGIRTYDSVDHAPVMEKVWAAKAGLGYVGKNGCLITPELGSYVVLGTMVLTAQVDTYAEGPRTDQCGRCRRCIDSCPTEAILPGRQVDARACLSYQTIENAADIPEALRPALSDTVLGCDICQTVCPLNEDVGVVMDARFVPRAAASLDAREIAALSPERFTEVARGTPLMRPGYDGVRRNAAYTLGAIRDAHAQPILERLCEDPSPTVREAAIWALGQIRKLPLVDR